MSIGGIYRKLDQISHELQGAITQDVRNDLSKQLDQATKSVTRLQCTATEVFSQDACLDLLDRISQISHEVDHRTDSNPAYQSNLYSLGVGAQEVDIDEIATLFDTALLFFQEKSAKGALKAFRMLPQACLIEFHRHMTILKGDPSRPLAYPKETAKALIKIAHERSNSPQDYYSDQQILEMISDLENLTE